MNEWLPIVGTLSGAAIAGAISFLLHWSANRHTRATQKLTLASEAAKWAAERELEGMRRFYGTVEKLYEAVGNFRRQQAWANLLESKEEDYLGPEEVKTPDWIPSHNDARGALEEALYAANSEKIFLDSKIQAEYDKAIKPYQQIFMAMNTAETLQALAELNDSLFEFRRLVADHYRTIFENRKTGADIGLK